MEASEDELLQRRKEIAARDDIPWDYDNLDDWAEWEAENDNRFDNA